MQSRDDTQLKSAFETPLGQTHINNAAETRFDKLGGQFKSADALRFVGRGDGEAMGHSVPDVALTHSASKENVGEPLKITYV